MDIEGYNTYQIYDDGRVWSKKRNIFLKPYVRGNKEKYKCLDIFGGPQKTRKTMAVHRLVALHYLPNPDNLPEVHHKDNDRNNNHVSNLEWVSHQTNCQSINQTKQVGYIHKRKDNGRYRLQYSVNGVKIDKTFKTEIEAECYLCVQEMITRVEQDTI